MSPYWSVGWYSCLFAVLFDCFALVVVHKFLLRDHFLYYSWDQGPYLKLSLSLVDRDNIRHCPNMPKVSRFQCRNSKIFLGIIKVSLGS